MNRGRPYEDFREGDYLLVQNRAGDGLESVRLLSLTVTQADDGHAEISGELNRRINIPERERAELLVSLGMGVQGETRISIPVSIGERDRGEGALMARPHMPANMPITRQRTVRGEAVRRMPGRVAAPKTPAFSWPGVVDHLDLSPKYPVKVGGSFTEIAVTFVTAAAVDFDVIVNGSVVDSITTAGSGSPQLFTTAVSLTR